MGICSFWSKFRDVTCVVVLLGPGGVGHSYTLSFPERSGGALPWGCVTSCCFVCRQVLGCLGSLGRHWLECWSSCDVGPVVGGSRVRRVVGVR